MSYGFPGRVVSLGTGIALKHVIAQLPASAPSLPLAVMHPCHDELDPSGVKGQLNSSYYKLCSS